MNASDVVVLLIEGDDEIIPAGADICHHYDILRIDNPVEAARPLEHHDIGIVIYDRELPHLSIETFLDRIGSLRYEYQIAMVTDVEPRLEMVQKGVDAFIPKPLTTEKVELKIQYLIDRMEFSRRRREFWSLLSAREALENKLPASALETHEEYTEICKQVNYLSGCLCDSCERLEDETEFVSHLRDIEYAHS